ncbi:hypothetical protein [Nocardia asteroides]|uniref:Uncharacterized protein n=1 Tax=Nocardia asteroides NBRC 15531 TaxID=1110697 RepID=U5EDL8_NOCAS|nr:hypothetical protein [Nocardia asteroides]UGT50445.1 hypothetical protein LT345_07735 [Nocardia asteroides]GAD84506.1 hypothetical protein NCAST_24_01120 [Nocardia asteroides NBRC 15531]SFN08351.1 hypothetical protein SAMN05444423_10639 [Nocardia asteroides]VEG36752.1 Uncharacterised protein [Nocardia asteroides]
MTSPDTPQRTLILDPDLGPVEFQADRVSTVVSIFGTDENRPWRTDRPTTS